MLTIEKNKKIGIIGSGEVSVNIAKEFSRLYADDLQLYVADSNLGKIGMECLQRTIVSIEDLQSVNPDVLILGFRSDAPGYASFRDKLSTQFSCPIYSATEIFKSFPGVRGWPLLATESAEEFIALTNFVCKRLSDPISRSQYDTYCRWVRREAEVYPVDGVGANQYFVDGLVKLKADEVIVDCGAYIGDTLMLMIDKYGEIFGEYYAFEPDPLNFSRLVAYWGTLAPAIRTKVYPVNSAVSGKSGYLCFETSASQTSRQTTDDGIWVPTCSLVDFTFHRTPTFVKLDLEGADVPALIGMLALLTEWRPILCVAIYHNPQDYINIPLLLMTALKDYDFHVRSHNQFGLDFVFYCIPIERRLSE